MDDMKDMIEFLSIARNDRKREKANYLKKNYLVPDSYRMIRVIRIKAGDREVDLGIQVSKDDYYFYIIDNDENAYYSIREIYELLHMMAEKEGEEYVCNLLEEQMRVQEKDVFTYEEIEYEMRKSIVPDRDGAISVPDGSKEISYDRLFLLINMVQEKSSAMFMKKEGNEEYVNGIIRLLKVLVHCTYDHDILENKGWYWDCDEKQYVYKNILDEKEKKHKKYYLTDREYKDIMTIES